MQAAYGKLPLSFEANQGQTDKQVQFLSRGSGYALFLTPTEAVLTLHKPEAKAKGKREKQEKTDLAKLETQNSRLETVVRMQLVGANPNPQVVGLEELPGKSNYFLGNDPQNWHTNIPTYARVQYKDIYPGIDLIYYGNQRQLEYDFVVAPGADPKAIQLTFDGLPPHPVPLVAQPSWLRAGWKPAPLGERGPMPRVFAPSPLAGEGQDGGRSRLPLRIDDNGDLILHTACGEPCRTTGGEIRLHKPRIYQEINGIKQPIPGGYVLLEPETRNLKLETQNSQLEPQQVSFQVSAYDTSKLLIIDPVLSYSTYLGGRRYDDGLGIAVDSSGNAYVTGWTSSINFPTASPFQATRGGVGTYDVFVTKVNPTGSALVYSTYLGGSDYDYGQGIAVDSSGNAYVTGRTSSTNFPTANPLQATNGGGTDVFVAKLNAAGSTLLFSTYLGGSSEEIGFGIAVDSSGNAYVTGGTSSTNFPTANPLQATFGGGFYDVFVAKLNASGSTLLFSTYLGGSSEEIGFGIAVDSSGNAYVTGRTSSTNFPTANPLQATFRGFEDAFVAKIEEEREGICPATAALEEDPQKEIKLEVLYDFRDEVLAKTPTGQRYIELFYQHAEEGVWLMLSYPELLSHTRTLLERFLPTLQAVVAGREVAVTAADLADIDALLEAFAAQGSPELQADLRAIQEELWQGTLLDQFGIAVR